MELHPGPLDVESTHTLARTDNDSLFAHQPWRWAHTRHRPAAHPTGHDDPDRDSTRPPLDLLHDLIVNPAAHRDIPSGDIPSGDIPSGDIASGDIPSGDIPSGDIASRDIPHQRPAPLLHYSAHA